MSSKVEVGWTTQGEDGQKRHVNARRFGRQWLFFERPKRRGRDIEWIPLPEPPLSDWLELLDAVERRAARDLVPPDHVEEVRTMIRERFPEHQFS